MKAIFKFVGLVLTIVFLTILTQVGGLVLLVLIPFILWVRARQKIAWKRLVINLSGFVVCYLIVTIFIVPPVAEGFGRVPLPMVQTNHLKPANILTCILNRNYVKPALRDVTFAISLKMHERFPGTVVNYLDANFPFFDGFPLVPHLSHSDGRKLDLAFQYRSHHSEIMSMDVPSFIGYGVCEVPRLGERNVPKECEEKGFWQYSLLKSVVPQNQELEFDENRTRFLIQELAAEKDIQTIFVEPHLASRMNVKKKIRFHACQAVRHDDHIHVQIH